MFHLTLLHSPHLFPHICTDLSSFFSDSFSLSLSRHVIHRFLCRRVQGAGKVANVRTRIVDFTGRLSNSTRGFPFPASKRTTWRAASRFVLSYCRGLSRRCVLTTAARPMHGSERFRFPRVSGSSVCFAHPSSLRVLFRSLARSFKRVAFIALVAAERKRDTDRAMRNHAGI